MTDEAVVRHERVYAEGFCKDCGLQLEDGRCACGAGHSVEERTTDA